MTGSAVPATLTAHPRIKMRLLYGLLNQGEAYLAPTWLTREQTPAQIHMHQSSQHQAVDLCINVHHFDQHLQTWFLAEYQSDPSGVDRFQVPTIMQQTPVIIDGSTLCYM